MQRACGSLFAYVKAGPLHSAPEVVRAVLEIEEAGYVAQEDGADSDLPQRQLVRLALFVPV